MFTRSHGVSGTAADAFDGVSPYANRLAHDQKLRRRLIAAAGAGAAARKQARRQIGPMGVALRLGSDPVLRAQVAEAVSQLQQAKGRLSRKESHKARNALLLVSAVGAILAAVPSLRSVLVGRFRSTETDDRTADDGFATGPAAT